MSDSEESWESLGVSAALAAGYAQDARGFLPLLAGFLEAALPNETVIERRGGLFQKVKPISRITVTLGENIYSVEDGGRGPLTASRTKIVRGIRLKTDSIPMEGWLAEVSQEMATRAQGSEKTYFALKELLRG